MKTLRLCSLCAVLLIATAGCSAHLPPPGSLSDVDFTGELPSDFPELISLAYRAHQPSGPVERVLLSLSAAEKALDIQPGHELASILAARAAAWLLEFDPSLSRDEGLEIAQRGLAHAHTALAASDAQVEYIFLSGALLGQELRLSHSPGLIKMRQVEEYFQRAVDLDPSFDDGAPLRALGTLLVKAPPWPTGVGDPERGIELLQLGAESYPAHPASHLFLADALAAEGHSQAATEAYGRVLTLCEDDRWGVVCEKYAARARASN